MGAKPPLERRKFVKFYSTDCLGKGFIVQEFFRGDKNQLDGEQAPA